MTVTVVSTLIWGAGRGLDLNNLMLLYSRQKFLFTSVSIPPSGLIFQELTEIILIARELDSKQKIIY